jgi:alpha-galactosidase
MVRIGVIGAGSIAWSSTLVRDLCLFPKLWGSTVVLMDKDEGRLGLIHKFARRYASELGADLRFEKTRNLKEAVRDSDFVINTAMACGHAYYEKMREISEKHGYYRGINSVEWNMVSDYHTIWGYYQLKLMLEVAREVEDLNPEAWLLLLANPVFEGTTLISRETKCRVIGLCHGHLGFLKAMQVLEIDPAEAEFEAIGFNHLIWLTKFRYKGEDAYPLLDEWVEKKAPEYWERWRREQEDPFDVEMSPAAVDMYHTYGLFPVGDTVRNGTWKYHRDLETKKKWYGPFGGPDSEVGWKIYLWEHEQWLNRCTEAIQSETPLTELLPPQMSRESIVPLMNSIANDEPGIYQVNIPNLGTIPGIPDNVAVEVPAKVDGKGVHRIPVGGLPDRTLKLALHPRMMRMEWALEAFLKGGRDCLSNWLLSDPRTKSPKQAEEVIDDLLAIPENQEMARHFG